MTLLCFLLLVSKRNFFLLLCFVLLHKKENRHTLYQLSLLFSPTFSAVITSQQHPFKTHRLQVTQNYTDDDDDDDDNEDDLVDKMNFLFQSVKSVALFLLLPSQHFLSQHMALSHKHNRFFYIFLLTPTQLGKTLINSTFPYPCPLLQTILSSNLSNMSPGQARQ